MATKVEREDGPGTVGHIPDLNSITKKQANNPFQFTFRPVSVFSFNCFFSYVLMEDERLLFQKLQFGEDITTVSRPKFVVGHSECANRLRKLTTKEEMMTDRQVALEQVATKVTEVSTMSWLADWSDTAIDIGTRYKMRGK